MVIFIIVLTYKKTATIRKYNRRPKIKLQPDGDDFNQYFQLNSLHNMTKDNSKTQLSKEIDSLNRNPQETLNKTVCDINL